MKRIITIALFVLLFPTLSFGQLWPHLNTFGFDYGFPRDEQELKWLASHHDIIIGAGHFQTQKFSKEQYDILKKTNEDIILIPYVVIQAFTFKPMKDFMVNWVLENGYNPEELYLHYYRDTIVKTRTRVTKTSGTGTPSDRVCDQHGNLLNDGQQSNYYIALGYGGGTASNLEEARIYQFWNAGFEPRMNHLSKTWKKAYKAYILDVITIKDNNDWFADGVMLDTYQGIVDVTGYLPNMHKIIEVKSAGYGHDDSSARNWYAENVALYMGELREFLVKSTDKVKIYLIPNFGEVGYMHGSAYGFACVDQFDSDKLLEGAIEYLASPSKNYYHTRNLFKLHYEFIEDNPDYIMFHHLNTAWYDYGNHRDVFVLNLGKATDGFFKIGNRKLSTPGIPFNASDQTVKDYLEQIFGKGTVSVNVLKHEDADFVISTTRAVGNSGMQADLSGLKGAGNPYFEMVYGHTLPLGAKQFMIGMLYLYHQDNVYSALHYGTAQRYGPQPTFSDSHWDVMFEFDIGVPVIRSEPDWWGQIGTDRPFLVDHAEASWDSKSRKYDPRGRHVLAREFTNALVIVRIEQSNNNRKSGEIISELGAEPITYQLDREYRRLLEDNSLGPVTREITLGLGEGAILIKH